MMIIGMFVMGYGCYLYIGCELGCGPRDGVMVGLSSKLNKPIKLIRGSYRNISFNNRLYFRWKSWE